MMKAFDILNVNNISIKGFWGIFNLVIESNLSGMQLYELYIDEMEKLNKPKLYCPLFINQRDEIPNTSNKILINQLAQ